MDLSFEPQIKKDLMNNIYYRTQKLKLVGLEILSKNDKDSAQQLIDLIKIFIFQTKQVPYNTFRIVNYDYDVFKVELKNQDISQKNLFIELSLLWKKFNLTTQKVADED